MLPFEEWKRIIESTIRRDERMLEKATIQGKYAGVVALEDRIKLGKEMLADPEAAYDDFCGRVAA